MLHRMGKVRPKKTARQVMNECDLPNLVSVHTAKRILHEFKESITVKKPELTKNCLKARFSWRKRYELLDSDAWNKIIFSDETWVELHSDKREFVRKLPGKRNDSRYASKAVKFEGKSVIL